MSKQWFAYRYMAKIALVERGRRQQSSALGAFHATWEDAHKALTEYAEVELKNARRALEKAQGHYGNVRGMKSPGEPR